ncbi:MAG: 4-hydroxy-tetrahydrodipicolinate reductase [Bacillaceae bacterium]
MKIIRIILAGPRGKMGQEAIRMIVNQPHFQLVAVVDRLHNGKFLKDIEGGLELDVPIYEDAATCIQEQEADVFVDLTNPETGKRHVAIALAHRLPCVIGTTGFSSEELAVLERESEERRVGIIIAPNFALGAVLMMKFAKMAAHYFQDVEIIEMHHDRKLDAPSGTALKTAQMIGEVREKKQQGHEIEKETLTGARGGNIDGMRIHSVRLPGLVAHQQVLFGGDGQLLTLRHDSFDRTSFMSGIKLSIETVVKLDKLVYGLENIID